MDLKNAVAVCLISLFSATLVLLIARALDLQAASRLEPQLARICEELEAIRRSGGITAGPGGTAAGQFVDDGLMVYYFHGIRCPTCLAAESQAHETVQSDFASQLGNGEVIWKVLDYVKDPAGAKLAKKFDVADPTVVLARMNGGQIEDWKRLDRVLALAGDKPAFAEYVRHGIRQMLETTNPQQAPAPQGDALPIPVPNVDPSDIPIPTDPGAIPLPEWGREKNPASSTPGTGET